jgi:pimeloyl-ACP methyl ester carboxylesterase
MKTRYLSLSILLLALGFAKVSQTQAQENVPRFERSDCPIEVPSDESVECGMLTIPEDYANPEGPAIRTTVLIIHSRNGNPAKEALLFTEGGPGFSSLDSVWWFASTGFAEGRDIVILEQRGNKYSDPRLDCDFSVWWDDVQGHTPCLDSLRQRGIALEHYTAASIAADIEALMQVLDYERWILYGTSYSTRPIQLVMAHDPQDVKGVILHSTTPITETRYQHDSEHAARVLQVMFDDCAADQTCAQAYPNLEMQFQELVQKLNAAPVDLEMIYPGTNETFTLSINGGMLISWMVEDAFYGPAYPAFKTAYLPLLIDQLSQGEMGLLYPQASDYVSRWGSDAFSWGLYFAINCQDDAASTSLETVSGLAADYPELDGYIRHWDELVICDAWGLAPAPPLASEPVTSDLPTLVLAGSYDPITPPEWSRMATANLSNRTFVEFPAAGHSVPKDNPCAVQIIRAFLDNPNAKLDLGCVDNAPRPRFVLPDEIILAPAMYEIHYDELGYSKLEENLFLGSWLTLQGTGLVALIAGLVKLVRRQKQAPKEMVACLTHPLLILLAIIASIWGFGLRSALVTLARTSSSVLRFGLPAAYGWIFIVAPLIGLLTVALIVSCILAWKNKYWSVPGRIALSLTTLAAIIFSGLLAKWGLFTAWLF